LFVPSLDLYLYFVDRCLSFCTFSFRHYVVSSSSIYGFWLPLWYLQTLFNVIYQLIWVENDLINIDIDVYYCLCHGANKRHNKQNTFVIFVVQTDVFCIKCMTWYYIYFSGHSKTEVKHRREERKMRNHKWIDAPGNIYT